MPSPLHRLLALPLDGRVLILTHDNPDPDSLSSAVAMQYLLGQTRQIESVVAYSGIIGRAENRTMVERLALPIRPIGEVDHTRFAHIAIVDAQPDAGNHAVPGGRMPEIVVDHHPLREATRRAAFYDVRPDVGASATLLTGYLREARLAIPVPLATALLYGIRSETQDLGREVSDEDVTAYEHLLPLADREILAAIVRPALRRRYFEQLADGLSGIVVGERIALSLLGDVLDPDFVPEMADLIVRMEGIGWSLVTGAVDEKLYVSIRTNDPDGNAGALMQLILAGLGAGGGHGMRGGGNVPLSGRNQPETESEIARRFVAARGESWESLRGFRS